MSKRMPLALVPVARIFQTIKTRLEYSAHPTLGHWI